jgi:hypothetical protein
MSRLRGKQHWQRVGADFQRAAQQVRDDDTKAMRERAARFRAKHSNEPVQPAELMGARLVKDRNGTWHEVVRINPTTVTVLTGHSWTDRVPHDRIVEVRYETEATR